MGDTIYGETTVILTSHKRWIILGACLIAIALIVGAYYLSGRTLSNGTLSAEATEETLTAYASKDSDSDGLTDWKEALYGTDPNNANSFRADMTDGEAVAQKLIAPKIGGGSSGAAVSVPGSAPAAGSVTEKFALSFFESYVKTGGNVINSDTALQNFVADAVTDAQKSVVRVPAYTLNAVRTDAAVTLAAYAAAAEKAFASDTTQTPHNELVYFSDAVLKDDAVALSVVRMRAQAYISMAEALIQVSAPTQASAQHLALANATMQLGKTIEDMSMLKEDPVRAMIGLGNYNADARAFATALATMNTILASTVIAAGAPGSTFINLTALAKAANATQP